MLRPSPISSRPLAVPGVDDGRANTPTLRRGDADCNGTVGALDAALILQLDAGIVQSVRCPENADADSDGMVGPLDALLVLQYDAGILAELPEVA